MMEAFVRSHVHLQELGHLQELCDECCRSGIGCVEVMGLEFRPFWVE